ncbi:MAG: hypothetical protein ABIH17_12355, partial [Pseudomonadota bacterium]
VPFSLPVNSIQLGEDLAALPEIIYVYKPLENIQLYDFLAHIAEVSVQLVAVILLFIAVTIAQKANRTSMESLKTAQEDLAADRKEHAKAMADQRYDVLDRTYMDLVLLRVQHPDFNEPQRLYTEELSSIEMIDSKRSYESYAFALFNYLETIADKCNDEIDALARKKAEEAQKAGEIVMPFSDEAWTPDLVETWGPILVSESWHHRHWFADSQSRVDDRFKDKFRKLVATVIEERTKDEKATIDPLNLIRSAYA